MENNELQDDVMVISSEEETNEPADEPAEVTNSTENNEEATKQCSTKNPAAFPNVSACDSDGDLDSEQTCPICMDSWTSSGEHHLCCLRCGHLFGHSCILRWLQNSCHSSNRRCPQCNKKAAIKDIRKIYAKKLTSVDTSELDNMRTELKSITAEKNRIEMELSKYTFRQQLYQQQIDAMQSRIHELETLQSEIIREGRKLSKQVNKKFHLERAIDICKEGGCRVIEYDPNYQILVVSQKSMNPLFAGFGIRNIDIVKFMPKQFIFLHTQALRDISFRPNESSLLLSVGFDKWVKLVDVKSNIVVHSFQAESQLWSCCWSGNNNCMLFVGAQNGRITQFDIRQTCGPIDFMESHIDRSPVVSLASVPANASNGFVQGGFVACQLNSCYAYEEKCSKYIPKYIPLDGPFTSVRYNKRDKHILISSRPNVRQPQARHIVCTLEKGNDETVLCNVVHTFHAGNSQQLLSRPCHVNLDNDTLVAAHQESISSIPLWSVKTGKQIFTLPVSDPVIDMCSFDTGNSLMLATVSAKKLRLYNYSEF